MNNHYHPIIKVKFFLGVLSESERNLIPDRTYHNWKIIDQRKLTGFNANDPLLKNKEQFSFLYNHESARKLLSAYMIMFSSFKNILFSAKKVNSILREKKNLLIKTYDQCRKFIRSSEFESLTGISPKKIQRWQDEIECENSLLLQCKGQNPRQLTFEEQLTLVEELHKPENNYLHICDLWALLVSQRRIKCKKETFYKYARIIIKKFDLRRKRPRRKAKKITATKPFSILHMDCTIIRTDDGGRWYLHIIYDNYAKAILGIRAMLTPNSFDVTQHLKEVIQKYSLHDKSFSLYCDGGPENKGFTDVFLGKHKNIRKFVTSFSNGIHNNMIESFNAKFKRKLILALNLSSHDQIPQQLLKLKILYNNSPLSLLGTLTPNEVLAGKIPWIDHWPELENEINSAKEERIFINKLTCCME